MVTHRYVWLATFDGSADVDPYLPFDLAQL
jgi:hypothetical protein